MQLQFLSSLLQANQFTAGHASRNTGPHGQKVPAVTTKALPRNRLGHGEETTGKQRKRKRPSVFSNAARIAF